MEYASTKKEPSYDVLIGGDTLNKLKAVMDIKNSSIENYNVILPMQSLSAIKDPLC